MKDFDFLWLLPVMFIVGAIIRWYIVEYQDIKKAKLQEKTTK